MDFLTTDWLDESDESDLANDHGPRDDEIQVRWQSSQACPALKSLLVNAGGDRAGDKASGSGGGSGDGDKRKNAFRGPNGSPRKSLSTGSIFGSAIAGPSSLLWGGEPQTRQGSTSASRRPRALAAISRRDSYNSSTTTTTSSGSNANSSSNSSSSSSSDSLANFIQALQNVKAQVDENLHSKNLEYAAAAAGKGLGRTGKVAKKPLSRVGRHGHGHGATAHLTAAGQPYPLTRRRTVTVDPVLGRAADVKGKGRALATDRTVRERTRSSRPPSLMDIDDDLYCVQEAAAARGAESELVDADGMPPPALPPESDVEDAVMTDAPLPPPLPLPPQTRSFSRSHSTPHVDGGTAVRPLWAQQKPGITSRTTTTTTSSAGPVSSTSGDSTAAISTATTAATAIATTATTTTGVTVKPSTTRLAPPAQNARPKSPVNGAPAPLPSQQQQNRRPPVLGMRRVHTFSSSTTMTSGANANGPPVVANASQSRLGTGMASQSRYATPSQGQQLPTKQRGFKPPLLNRASTTTTTTAMTTGIRGMGATTGATTATSAASSAFKRTWSSGSTSTNSSSASGSALSGTTSGSAASTSSPSNTSRTSSFVHPGPTSSQTSSSEGDSPHPHRRVGSGGGSGIGGMRANTNPRRAVPKTGFGKARIEDKEEHEGRAADDGRGRAVDEHEDKDANAADADADDDFRMLSDDPNDSSYGDLIDFPFEEEALEEVMKMYD